MESYEAWMQASDKGRRELNILRMMGLFDRPAEIGAIRALLAESEISGLTDPSPDPSPKRRGESAGFYEVQWQFAVKQLRDLRLLSEKDKDRPDSLDCHPLIREHFGEKLKNQNPAAWKEAHSRLYEYYRNLPEKEFPDTLEEMEPLFAAVAHGCKAGRYQEAFDDVYWERISRKENYYSTNKLGAISADLAAIANFFDVIWAKLLDGFTDIENAIILNITGFRLRTLGRLQEAIHPLCSGLNIQIQKENWIKAVNGAYVISSFWLINGDIQRAISYARQSLGFAERTEDEFLKYLIQNILADTLFQANEISEAEKLFQKPNAIKNEKQLDYMGILYFDILLSKGKYQEVFDRTNEAIKISEQKNGYRILHLMTYL